MNSELQTLDLPDTGVTSAAMHRRIDELEQTMRGFPAQECPVTHRFAKGVYCREIFMPAGTLITSKIHLTQHHFVVLSGKAEVLIDGQGWITVEAGHMGITEPGTRRLVRVLEDCRWVTYHPTEKTDLAEIENDIILKHDEHLAGLEHPKAEVLP